MSYVSDAAIARLRSVASWPGFEDPRYGVEKEIGRGGMGTVYLGHDGELQRDVAIKVTNGAAAGGALEVRMRREARILAGLEHPGIVPIHDVGVLADGRLYTVMKLVRGATLDRHLGEKADLGERLRVFERLCEPVAFANARGVVHCDLKPRNVMVGGFGEVLVMDWGLAQTGEGGEGSGERAGTAGYMAPEQTAGLGVDARTDVHALGVILREIVGTLGDRRLAAICARATSARPEDRYADALALAADVRNYREGLPITAYAETIAERAWRVAVKYRVAVILVASYLLVRVLIAAFFRI